MTRIVSYNILAGGYNPRADEEKRTHQLTTIIRSANPDIVGIIEAINPTKQTHPLVIEEIAENLGMELVPGIEKGGEPARDFRTALLTRLPVVYTQIHTRPGILGKPLLEVCIQEENGQRLTAFVAHLTAAFHQGRGGGHLRIREGQEIVKIMEPLRREGLPHFIMGDFNSLSPGDPFQAHQLLRYVIDMDGINRPDGFMDGVPHLDAIVPEPLRFLKPLLCRIPGNAALSALFDQAAALYIPRTCMNYFRDAGYVDCYRRKHPTGWGFTCPAAYPAGRIDYILASPDLAERLEECHEITESEGIQGKDASDHLPVSAAFSPAVRPSHPSYQYGSEIYHVVTA
jgi:endonuclease/exonuclease/phosphatase family metal-dependent hydrolase